MSSNEKPKSTIKNLEKFSLPAEGRTYLCIDIKSFFASVECVERGLDPMKALLVVADPDRTDKTICLAVTPALKKLGVRNRCRVFEIPKNIDYIIAPPRMQKYIDYAGEIYGVYLEYVAKEDIHVYSIDEAFLDVTAYLDLYRCTAKELAVRIMDSVTKRVGVRSTCGIGTNLYLTKIALDITAKHAPDFIGYLDEELYRKTLWDHRPLTDFWRIGAGTAKRLENYGIHTMREIAEADEELIYKLFGIDGELLIDHAWGREPVTIADIKAYKSKTNCFSSSQVLPRDYSAEECALIVREMTDQACLGLVAHGVVTGSMTLYVGYAGYYQCEPARGTAKFVRETAQDRIILPAVLETYWKIVDPNKKIRRVGITSNNVVPDDNAEVYTLFAAEDEMVEKNKSLQEAVLDIRRRFGSNAVLKGMNLEEGAMTVERNGQIGGHKKGV